MSRRASDLAELDRAILAAHAIDDRSRLARLYGRAGLLLDQLGASDEAAFVLTQAYVFALETGLEEEARDYHQRLVALGREA